MAMPSVANPTVPAPAATAAPADVVLVCRVGGWLCALPIAQVDETLRPLPLEPLAAAPPFVLGLSIIRGLPTPVVDTGALLGAPDRPRPGRLVVLRLQDGNRRVALAVEAVLGVRTIPTAALDQLPPLLRDAGREVITAVGALDHAFLVALHTGRLVPESVWDALATGGEPR
jgi:purine-binding chemotaxis protein CheW